MKMKDSMRSGGVLKKKSSSGCLIIKKKVENGSSGGGWEGLSGNSSERKRPRLVAGGFGASDEDESSEFMRGKVNEKISHGGSIGYRRNEFENMQCDKNNVGIDERRRSRLGSLEFDDEYIGEFDESRMREEYYLEDRFKMVGSRGDENHKDFVVGPSRRNVVADRLHFDASGSKSSKGGRNRGFELEEEEAEMPTSLLRLKYPEVGDQPIRLQGKNGVLKVMVNKNKKKMELHRHNNYDPKEVEARARSWSEDVPKKGLLSRMPIHPASKPPENRGLWMEKERTVEKEQVEVRMEKVKPKLSKGIKARESEISGMSKDIKVTDTPLKLAPPGLLASSSKKVVKRDEERVPPEYITPVKGKEGKIKRSGGCTEKQMLREKIREMLIDSGWTIDYRPRRNRDYLDAVYINPSGTAYWSIIKAYEALKKQLDEDNSKTKLVIDSPSFAPLSEDLINKLTRQTKKKIEQEIKRKRKEDGLAKSAKISSVREDARESSDSDHNEERLSSCKKQYKYERGKYPDVDQGSDSDLRDDSPKSKSRKMKVENDTTTSNLNVLQGRTSKVIGRCTLRVRCSDIEENSPSDVYVPYSGKRTLLAWLIDSGTAQLSEKVQYMNRRRNRVMLEGWITRDGIHCSCCSKILTVSKFELHAGSKLRQPFQNIYLESGPSLLQCQIDAWNRRGESVCRNFHTVGVDGDDPDDDTCGICGDGGALICCDSCPSTFHQICLEIKVLPSGDWHCPNCICKFCGDANGNADDENNGEVDELARCSFCEEKYHKSCSKGIIASSMSSIGASFCGLKCQELYDHLQKILGVKLEMEGGFSWSLIQRTDVSDTLHRGFPQRVESNSKLAVALSIMDECFLRINDRRSGINRINNVIYNIGSNFNRLNYCGFYTGILERGDEIISAASIRIHGTRLAEMPFIGTRQIYRRQGMCKRLLSAIETELQSLEVKQLIIPAIPEQMTTWITGFGFHQLDDMLRKEIKSMNMVVFPGTDMLQKPLVKSSDGMKISVSIKKQPQLPVKVEKSDIYASINYEKQMSNDSTVGHDAKMNDKVSEPESDSPAPVAPSNNTASSTPDSVAEPNAPLASNGATLIKSEVESNHKESSVSSNGPLTDCKYKNTVMRSGNSPVGAVVSNACTIEAPCVKPISDSSVETLVVAEASGKEYDFAFDDEESTHLIGNIGSSVKGFEDADPQPTVDNGPALEPSSLGEEDQPTARAMKGDLHLSMEALANSTAVYGAINATRNAEAECKDDAQLQNGRMATGAGPDEAANPVRTDKPEVSITSSESLAQTIESNTKSSHAEGENNR